HGDTGFRRQRRIAARNQDRRRAFDRAEQPGIARHVMEQIARAGRANRRHLPLDPLAWSGPVSLAPTGGDIWKRLQRRAGIPEPAQRLGIAHRPALGLSQQADAGERLVLPQRWRRVHFARPTFGSVPASRRAIFSRWRSSTITAIAASTGTNSQRPNATA